MENQENNENWQGINTKDGVNTIKDNTINIYNNTQDKPKSKPNLTQEELKDLYCQSLEQIKENYQYIKLFHTKKQIKLQDQYIPIQVTLERRFTHQIETIRNYGILDLDSKDAYATKRFKDEIETKVDWKAAKKDHKKIMVLADPGMGKSTLLRMEVVTAVKEQLEKLQRGQNTQVDQVIIPLFIRLSELAKQTGEIIDIIPSILKVNYPKIIDKIEDYLQEKLTQGKCLLLLDALDEVPKDQRLQLSQKLNRFLKNYPCPIICTSRIVGYGGNFIDGAKEVEIVPFDDQKTAEYIETWFNNADGNLDNDTVSAAGLINELKNKPQIQGLAQNPLLLSLLCSLYQSKGLTLPARRTQVYQKAVNYILSQWSKDNQRKLLDDGWVIAKTNLLEYLAYQFSCQNQEVFSGRELSDKINEYLNKTDHRDFSNKQPQDLIKELTEEDGIIQTLSAEVNQYLFLHRTFQEYFTASYLKIEIEKNEKEGIKLIHPHFWQYDWHETIILVAGLLKNPQPLLTKLRREKDDIFKTMLLLAGSCLTEVQTQQKDDALTQKIVKEITDFWRQHPNVDFITSVLISLGKIGNEAAVNPLIQALTHSKYSVRWGAAYALRNEAAVNPLIQALTDSEYYVRSIVAETLDALGNIGNEAAVNPLIQALTDSHINVRSHAAEALGKIGHEAAVKPLIQALTDSDSYVRSHVAEALGKIGHEAAVNPLIRPLTDSEYYAGSSLEEALGKIGNEAAVNPLIQALTDSEYDVRRRAVYALGKIGNEVAVKALIQALTHSDSGLKWFAAEALGKVGNETAVNGLIQALTDSNGYVQWLAAEALGKIGNETAVNPLILALTDSDILLRWPTADELGNIGNEAAFNALILALTDSNIIVRSFAAEALGKIERPEILQQLINNWNIDIYEKDIFIIARKLNVRYSRHNLPYIPVYPNLVRYFPVKRFIKRLFQR
ncbi:NACHT domain-containing protein [Crocosphaera sp. XPORK-15E]|uniref:NACHT domain-containing protein n=1 Tax=Crocosphaera sp. XPORK-15E TaxID=3110247 RepID=UPI002B21AA27|nr:HEAT repeat domain-containing protein [Crocosphaera sp. XPORK-15E]MEA5533355.1 HEAT repeat domain-containing protein [Crocosphaera sp. XPORK-15E]